MVPTPTSNNTKKRTKRTDTKKTDPAEGEGVQDEASKPNEKQHPITKGFNKLFSQRNKTVKDKPKTTKSKEKTKKPSAETIDKDEKKSGNAEEKKPSLEKDKEEKKTDGPTPQMTAAMSLCKYVTRMKESSVDSYFDKNLANYSSPTHTSSAEWEKNMSKNRSKDHKMLDHSRVKLQEEDIYINASHVSFDDIETDFILAQYPLPNCALDFWKMIRWLEIDRVIAVFEPYTDEAIEEFHKVPDTLALPSPDTSSSTPTTPTTPTTESPADQVAAKSAASAMPKSARCDPIGYKSFFPLATDSYFNMSEWLINTKKEEPYERENIWFTVYSVEVVQAGCSDSLITRVFNCATWPPKKMPTNEKQVFRLARIPWRDLTPRFENAKKVRHKPVVVMCDLGLDRSATVVFTYVLIELILGGKKIDCDALFRKFRDQRAGVFTASMFFSFAIRSVLCYFKSRFRNDKDAGDLTNAINAALGKIPPIPKK